MNAATLALLLALAPARAAVLGARPLADAPVLSAPGALPSFAAPSLAPALAPALAAPLSAPSVAPAAPAAAAAPALAVAAVPAAAPSPRAALARAAASGPDLPGAAFDGSAPAPAEGWSPAVGPIAGRPSTRFQVLTAAELGLGGEPDGPRPPAPAPAKPPFLYRHHRIVRFFAAPVLRLFYRVRVEGVLPPGPVLIVPNHVSFLDPVLVAYAAGRPVRFLMYRPIYETRGLQWLFRALGAIPISVKDPKPVIEASLNEARRALAAGQSVAIFPEGMLTRDGEFGVFRRGFERVAAGLPVPVVPAHVGGMWGSALSRHPRKGWGRSLLSRLRGRRSASVRFGAPLAKPEAGLAREAVARLAR